MSTSATLRALDGMTPADLAYAMKGKVDTAAADCMKAATGEALDYVNTAGRRHFIRNRKRNPVRLGAKLGPHSSKQAIIYGVPAGFWTIVEKGSKPHRIERRLAGRGSNRRAQLLSTPYGPRPYVLHPGHGTQGHPWEIAMTRVNHIPPSTFEPSLTKAFKGIFGG